MTFTAKPNCCEEQTDLPGVQVYMPCNKPATKLVYSDRDRTEYRMCEAHAYHNVKNRGCEDRGEFVAQSD